MNENLLKLNAITDILKLSNQLKGLEEGYMEGMDLSKLPLHILLDLQNSISCLYLAEENAAICYYGKDYTRRD